MLPCSGQRQGLAELVRNCGLHPLIYTRLEFDLARDVGYRQRFPGLGSDPPQTGHTFSVGLIIGLALHLEHVTLWSLTRLISSGSRLVIFIILYYSTIELTYPSTCTGLYRFFAIQCSPSLAFKSLNYDFEVFVSFI